MPTTPTPTAEPITATITETTARTGLSRATLYRLASAGKIRMVKAGRTTLVVWSSVRDHLATLPDADLRRAA